MPKRLDSLYQNCLHMSISSELKFVNQWLSAASIMVTTWIDVDLYKWSAWSTKKWYHQHIWNIIYDQHQHTTSISCWVSSWKSNFILERPTRWLHRAAIDYHRRMMCVCISYCFIICTFWHAVLTRFFGALTISRCTITNDNNGLCFLAGTVTTQHVAAATGQISICRYTMATSFPPTTRSSTKDLSHYNLLWWDVWILQTNNKMMMVRMLSALSQSLSLTVYK